MKHEPILKRFNRTDNRVYVLRAVLWSKWRENKFIGQEHRSILFRRNLLCFSKENGIVLSELGIALAKRHEDQFRSMHDEFLKAQALKRKPTGRALTDEQKQKMREGRTKR